MTFNDFDAHGDTPSQSQAKMTDERMSEAAVAVKPVPGARSVQICTDRQYAAFFHVA